MATVACTDGGAPTAGGTPPRPTVTATSERPSPSPPSPAATTPAPTSPSPTGPVVLGLETVVDGLDQPLVATGPTGDDRLFIAERAGTVRILRDGRLLDEPFLDISQLTRTGGEYGLLGLAFHPDHPRDPRFFVHYSDASDGSTRIAEYRISEDPDRADPDSARLLLTVPQPASNHNGGTITFGPDGHLFIGLGDGGGAGDTYGNGQDPSTLLGAMLRIDVDSTSGDRPYAIPPDNPFVDGGGAPEVWAYGLRNPYRFSFDEGLVYIGDVGQSDREEVDVAPADAAGLNYGWPVMEGSICYRSSACDPSGLTLPAVEYAHDGSGVCGVIGGHVYRGPDASLSGTYFYGDLCARWVRSFRYVDGEVTDQRDRTEELGLGGGSGGYELLSFGQDGSGRVYVLTRTAVHRIVVR